MPGRRQAFSLNPWLAGFAPVGLESEDLPERAGITASMYPCSEQRKSRHCYVTAFLNEVPGAKNAKAESLPSFSTCETTPGLLKRIAREWVPPVQAVPVPLLPLLHP